MPTAINTTVKVYKGIPLIKGGTEVLYLSGAAAEGKLSGAAASVLTYSQYYYTRENRSYIQVDDVIGNVEGANYVGFQNISHGGKWYFGFIDEIVYINDNCTEIRYTIDPFTTFLGDCSVRLNPYVIRNTQTPDTDYGNNEEDFDFYGKGPQYETVSHNTFDIAKTITMFVCDTTFTGSGNVSIQGFPTGIQFFENATVGQIQQVIEAGGSVLGVYGVDSQFSATGALSGVSISPALNFLGTAAKLKGGQYNKISVVSGGVAREYDLMKFTNKPAIQFMIKRLFNPAPCIAVYPLDYEGVAENTAEGIVIPYPSIAMNYQDNLSVASAFSNLSAIWKSMVETNAGDYKTSVDPSLWTTEANDRGIRYPNFSGAFENISAMFNQGRNRAAALPNFTGVLGNLRKAAMPSAGINTSAGNLVLNSQNQIIIDVVHAHHYASDITSLDQFFDYYGYSVNTRAFINTLDKSYLQVGEDIFYGSEADDLLNSYAKRGIKIKRDLP